MHLRFTGVNDAFTGIVRRIHEGEIPVDTRPSRNGEVLAIREPVIITYDSPRERVLFNVARDANCFFTIFEALWMLAGRNDLAPLEYYVSTFGQFSDDGKTLNGAYGYRWRHAARDVEEGWEVDQLEILITHLRLNPYSRRAVLDIWNVEDDLLKIDASKDCACNLALCFSVEQGPCKACNGKGYQGGIATGPLPCIECHGTPAEQPRYLNTTVYNRSNDLVLGALGANVVHFSFLAEYMACALGLDVGTYNQVSNNLHVYTSNWKPEAWIESGAPVDYPQLGPLLFGAPNQRELFDEECKRFVDLNHAPRFVPDPVRCWDNLFLQDVAQPMMNAWHCHKRRDYPAALEWMQEVQAEDWKQAGITWLQKRILKSMQKSSGKGVGRGGE